MNPQQQRPEVRQVTGLVHRVGNPGCNSTKSAFADCERGIAADPIPRTPQRKRRHPEAGHT
jgi:hypothetical protein